MKAGRDEIYSLLSKYNNCIWEKQIYQQDVDVWLDNFQGTVLNDGEEKEIALDILSNFIFYNENEIKYLCNHAFNLFKRGKVRGAMLEGAPIKKAESLFHSSLKKFKFSHIGRPGESGCFILYYFRQANNLPISIFLKRWDEVNCDDSGLLLVDDFLGTGNTAIGFWESQIIQKILKDCPDVELYYLALVALRKGIENVKKSTDFNIICPQVFEEDYRVFSSSSSIFPDAKERGLAKKVCEKYGSRLEGSRDALGYKNSQAIIGFHHNVPNNTLPIIWSDRRGWHPIFKRERKAY